MVKLSDTQSILLARAAQQEGGSLYPLAPTLQASGGVVKSVAALVKSGLAEERETAVAATVYRSDGDLRFGVYATTAGLAAIGVSDDDADRANVGGVAPSSPPAPAASLPANGSARTTKAAALLALLGRGGGATMPELIEATSWLPHTVRAALTGLRKKGHSIARRSRNGVTCYFIEVAA